MDGKLSLTDRDYILPSVPSVWFDHMIEGPIWRLATCFTDGKHSFTDRDYMLPSVPSVQFDHMIEDPVWCLPTCFTDGKHCFTDHARSLHHLYHLTIWSRALYDGWPYVSQMVTLDCDYMLPFSPSVWFGHMIEDLLWCFPTCFTDGKLWFTDCAHSLPSAPSVRFDHMIEGPVWWLPTFHGW